MTMIKTLVVVVALASTACSHFTANPFTGPSSTSASSSSSGGRNGGLFGPMSVLVGTWTGVTIADPCDVCGESGDLSVVFLGSPANDLIVNAEMRWLGIRTPLPFHGTLSGTLFAMVIEVNPNENPGGTLCGYRATGELTENNTMISGTYFGVGGQPGGPCGNKRGRFSLRGQSIVPPPTTCLDSGAFPFPQGPDDYLFTSPTGGRDHLGPYPFVLSAGPKQILIAAHDDHARKMDGPQPNERLFLIFLLRGVEVARSGVSRDLRDEEDDLVDLVNSIGNPMIVPPGGADAVILQHNPPTVTDGLDNSVFGVCFVAKSTTTATQAFD